MPSIPIESAFRDFEWKSGFKTSELQLNRFGFFEDHGGGWLLVRKVRTVVPLETAQIDDLYNGDDDGGWNDTEGRGMYFANHPRAAEAVRFVGGRYNIPNELFVARVSADQILSTAESMRGMARNHKAAVLLLRARAVIPGIPNPGSRGWDRLYGDTQVVTTPPLAMARLFGGRHSWSGPETRVPPRWAIVRDLSCLELVGKRAAIGREVSDGPAVSVDPPSPLPGPSGLV